MISLGHRPRISNKCEAVSAESAIHSGIDLDDADIERSIETRFQRWFVHRSESWGDAPG
jgi:hypothetical protein